MKANISDIEQGITTGEQLGVSDSQVLVLQLIVLTLGCNVRQRSFSYWYKHLRSIAETLELAEVASAYDRLSACEKKEIAEFEIEEGIVQQALIMMKLVFSYSLCGVDIDTVDSLIAYGMKEDFDAVMAGVPYTDIVNGEF